ncbi:type VII secretion target [Kitasatospora sp. NBC_00240]|nr:type VII secretion target [Kitasatospora sp. NBC_00240]
MPDTGGSGGFRVHPDELRAAGKAVQETADRIPGETEEVLASSDRTEGQIHGLQTTAALNDCTDAWRSLLDNLHTEMNQQGQNLIHSAEDYQNANTSVRTPKDYPKDPFGSPPPDVVGSVALRNTLSDPYWSG